jgi:hypothetical protein
LQTFFDIARICEQEALKRSTSSYLFARTKAGTGKLNIASAYRNSRAGGIASFMSGTIGQMVALMMNAPKPQPKMAERNSLFRASVAE